MKKFVYTSGYFNPLHKGHIRLFQEAKKYGKELIVIVNNDFQVKLKGAKPFMTEDERLEVVRAIRYVDAAILAIDTDRTVRKTLAQLEPGVFVKGGDSTIENVPEMALCKRLGFKVVFGVGGDKVQSSSWLKDKIK